MKNKFTIITVVKNNKNGITKTIKSVLNQNFKNYEYIVIDGNSTDGTFSKIKKLKKIKKYKKFKFLRRKDISYYDSLNFGIKKSQGQYIGVLNSGDFFINKNILSLIDKNLLRKTKLFYNNLFFTKKNNVVRLWNHKVIEITKFNLFKIPHSTLFIKKNVYKKVGLYCLDYKISSDLDFIIRLNKNYSRIQHLNFSSINMEYGGLSTNLKSLMLKLKEDFSILINHHKFYFIIFYFMKIYFKLTDFKLKNLIKVN